MASPDRQQKEEAGDQVIVEKNGVGNHSRKVQIVKGKPAATTGWRYMIKPNRRLIPLKVFILFFYGGVAALYPYLVIHMKSLGITVTQTGLMYTIYPICVCVGAPLAGIIGDKSGRYKLTLVIFLMLGIVLHVLLLFAVPKYEVVTDKFHEHISQVDLQVSCKDLQENSHQVITGTSLLSSNTSLQSTACDDTNITVPLLFDDCLWTCPQNFTCPQICMVTASSSRECFTLDELSRTSHSELAWLNISTGPVNSHDIQRMTGRWSVSGSRSLTCQNTDNDVTGCTLSCQARVDVILPCWKKRTEGSQFKTFAIYLAIRLSCGLALSLSFTLADASLIQMVEDHNGDIGINRAFSYVGFTAVPPLSGMLLDYASKIRGAPDYAPAFYIYAACHFLAVTVLCLMDLNVRPSAKNVMAGAAKLLKYPRVVAFVTIFCIIGLAWGFLETFLFWLLEVNGLAFDSWEGVVSSDADRYPKWRMFPNCYWLSARATCENGLGEFICRHANSCRGHHHLQLSAISGGPQDAEVAPGLHQYGRWSGRSAVLPSRYVDHKVHGIFKDIHFRYFRIRLAISGVRCGNQYRLGPSTGMSGSIYEFSSDDSSLDLCFNVLRGPAGDPPRDKWRPTLRHRARSRQFDGRPDDRCDGNEKGLWHLRLRLHRLFHSPLDRPLRLAPRIA
ncbi:hypothetical protein RvY_01460 [Ramazzottius varieornatus]|uniref:Major facilitator superfamily associated domain-containing protein n=1 Tax=Ramazzottius varieornatus TaxID=947166 RepID=A0A1D1UKA8_RAMVA|nr:hypothetical protein RvY_01460 [Ramazzottius varieornatus]